MFDLNKKEKPFTSFSGFGGGGLGLSGGVTKQLTYVDDVFSTTVYPSNNGTLTVNTGIDNTEKSLIWAKRRNSAFNHALYDTERGLTKRLSSNTTNAESTHSDGINSFNANGFTTGNDSGTNYNGNYVAWNFKAAPGFFDVVTYTGNGSVRQIAHSLGSKPGMIITKSQDNNHNWGVYHQSMGATKQGYFNAPNSFGTATSWWNNTEPTSTVFTLGTEAQNNSNGINYVAYIFAHNDAQFGTDGDESIIKCGSYTGNGGTNEINLGFEAQWLIIKDSSSATNWFMVNNMMNDKSVVADESSTEVDNSYGFDGFKSTGFAVKSNNNNFNGSGHTYIYMAIRRPNKPPEISTDVFAIDTGNSSSTIPAFDSGFPVDFAFSNTFASVGDKFALTRLTGKLLRTNETEAEVSAGNYVFDSNVGFGKQYNSTNLSYMFKRAPGFMDVVTYTGTGSLATHNHNLTVVPELMFVKHRTSTRNWRVYAAPLGAGSGLVLNTNDGSWTASSVWNDTAPTSSVFTVNTYTDVNQSGASFVNYLFATLPGISKVGSYSGNTGYAVNVDCGFTNGARFILIKRMSTIGSSGNGDWYVWDTLRGIASGNDPYLLLNETAAQVTNTDYIDPLSTGFTVTSSAPQFLNATGSTYLFLAIA